MPNDLVFNNVASNLLSQMFGLNPLGNVVPIQTDNAGNILIDGTVTVSGGTIDTISALTAGTVTVTGGTIDTISALTAGTVTVTGGTVTVTGGTIDTISALTAGTVTVTGGTIDTISALTAGTVTVSGGTIDALTAGTVTVSGGTVTVQGTVTANTVPAYEETSTTLSVGTTTVDVLEIDTSQKRFSSFYIYNTGNTETVTARLEISPTDTTAYYLNDNTTATTIGPNSKAILVPGLYLRFTKLLLSATASTPVEAYFNGRD